MNKEVAFSTMVENIPDTARSSPALYGYFDKLFPGKVGLVWPIKSLLANYDKGAGQSYCFTRTLSRGTGQSNYLTQTNFNGTVQSTHLTQITQGSWPIKLLHHSTAINQSMLYAVLYIVVSLYWYQVPACIYPGTVSTVCACCACFSFTCSTPLVLL